MDIQTDATQIDRRRFLAQIAAGCVSGAALTAACSNSAAPREIFLGSAAPRAVPFTLTAGKQVQRVNNVEFVLYVPTKALTRSPVPIMIVLHGANKGVDSLINVHMAAADSAGIIVVAPYSSDFTWDAIHTRFGVDVTAISSVLQWVFDRVPADWSKVVLSGFSDGATYALGLGRANANVFPKVICYSPGFILDVPRHGRPPITISHGTADIILPYSYTQSVIVPTLTRAGYAVDFQSFGGPHQVNIPTMQDAMAKLGV